MCGGNLKFAFSNHENFISKKCFNECDAGNIERQKRFMQKCRYSEFQGAKILS